MRTIRFLSVANALELHAETIGIEGGLSGVRDLALLESAIAMPMQQFGDQYLHRDLAAMAAAYLFHICCNHPFLDGNKRAATVVALVFLRENGHELAVAEQELEDTVRAVASGQMSKAALTEWLRAQLARKPGHRAGRADSVSGTSRPVRHPRPRS